MSTTQTSPTTAAEALRESPVIAEAVDAIVAELRQARASITGVRGPASEEAKQTLEDWLERQTAVKGRGAVYPYVGSGMGNGPLVELADGSVKFDLINGIGVNMFGHADPDLVATAVRASVNDVFMQGNLQYNADAIEFGELLIREASRNSNLKHAFLTNSGVMANESALKIAFQKKHGRAPRIIAFNDCFMGRSWTMSQIGDNPAGRVGLPLNTLVDYMPFYDPERGEESIEYAVSRLRQYLERYPGQHACFVMELVQGEGGFNIAPREFFEPLMKLCRENNVAVWADEVQTFGRNEALFYFDQLGVGEYIDIVTLGKMSQVCALLFTEQYSPKPGLLSGTFVGSTISLHVGRRMLERLLEGGYYGPDGKIAMLQRAFREQAEALVRRRPEWFPEVRRPSGETRRASGVYGGVGGMMRLTPFAGDREKIIKTCHALYERGVISFWCGHGPYHVRFLPPVGVMEPSHFDAVFPLVEQALADVA